GVLLPCPPSLTEGILAHGSAAKFPSPGRVGTRRSGCGVGSLRLRQIDDEQAPGVRLPTEKVQFAARLVNLERLNRVEARLRAVVDQLPLVLARLVELDQPPAGGVGDVEAARLLRRVHAGRLADRDARRRAAEGSRLAARILLDPPIPE